jgi:hypothetical protein
MIVAWNDRRMEHFGIDLTAPLEAQAVGEVVEAAAAAEGLSVTLKGTLAGYPGCTHWHFKRGRERGTLEATFWPRENRLWLSIQSGRTGDWTLETAERLRDRLRQALRL